MAFLISTSRFTLPSFILFLFFSASLLPIFAINDITDLLSSCRNLSDFSNLLTATAVASDLSSRTSLTLLAVPNSYLHTSEGSDLASKYSSPSSDNLPDILRYHVLLEYLSLSDLRLIPPTGKLITTLFQTTGRASSNSGTINVTRDPVSSTITFHSSTSNATVISFIKAVPYNISIFSVNALLVPSDIDLMASESRPLLGLNITKALVDGLDFNVAASMLTASGVEGEFEAEEGGAGLTIFVPTDEAFSELPSGIKFQSLTAEEKAIVLKFHVLHSYYPLGSLQSIVNPVQPTLATEAEGAGSFTLNISRVNGSVLINSGIVQATVTRTVIDQNPVAFFGVSKVLLPKEYFCSNPVVDYRPTYGAAQPPETAVSPEPNLNGPPSRLSSSPPVIEVRSEAGAENGLLRSFLGIWCTTICLLIWH